jgi:hypothetical protein
MLCHIESFYLTEQLIRPFGEVTREVVGNYKTPQIIWILGLGENHLHKLSHLIRSKSLGLLDA